ncbi:nucleotide exchange factor GrpE [Aerococcaceae bacterium NML191219]|nr:nucleotide exchange factor GrpE [Aerococcaceae bacterium NML191219]
MAEELEKEVVEMPDNEESSVESMDETTEIVEVDPLAELQAERDKLEDQLLRMQAEIANMKRIHTREKQDAAKYRSQSLATNLLDVIDNLERALATEATSEDALALKKGIEMVYAQFIAAFEKEQITVINPLNQAFDPNLHQAVSVMPASEGQESETVVNVLQKGYQLSDRILRPAMVIVSE